ncbi:glycine cleavage T protein [Chondrocystis sp. NIES-4102]|nr:glycine cleavage T protein [Chondrocystis sp. NIES-4102]
MELRKVQESAGAVFNECGVLTSFNNDHEAIKAIPEGVTICDRSLWGLIKITGADRLRYLHNQSTNDFQSLNPGQGCETVFVTSTARTLDLATAYVTEDAVLVLVSPNRRAQLLAWLDRFIFPFDKVELTDISAEYCIFSLFGQQSSNLLSQLTSQPLKLENLGDHQIMAIAEVEVRLANGSGLATPGYTLLIPQQQAVTVWSELIAKGAIPFGETLWSTLRIQQGRPAPDHELTEEYNPLEAGLWQTVSFTKGCYIGQETIARLNTYKGIKQKLWGLKLNQAAVPGTPITIEDTKVGVLTSYTDTPTGGYGLGYIRTKAGGAGLQVQVGEAEAEIIPVPFIEHQE